MLGAFPVSIVVPWKLLCEVHQLVSSGSRLVTLFNKTHELTCTDPFTQPPGSFWEKENKIHSIKSTPVSSLSLVFGGRRQQQVSSQG